MDLTCIMLSEGSQIQKHRLYSCIRIGKSKVLGAGVGQVGCRVAGSLGRGLFCTMKLIS